MKTHATLLRVSAFAVIVVLVGSVTALRIYNEKTIVPDDSLVGKEAYWQEQITKIGAKEAYERLDLATAHLGANQRHVLAHVFGGALYKEKGTAALSVCDARFSYGCFHEFIGQAIAEEGLDAVSLLNRACIDVLGEDAGFCQHGVGHGIQTHFGYSEENLRGALEMCFRLPQNDPIGGCAGGIFMEYNMRTMIAQDAQGREVTHESMFQPCLRLNAEKKRSCVYWQTQWWQEIQFSGASDAETFATIGQQCRDMVDSSELLRTCFEGIGNVIPGTGPVTRNEVRALCEAAAHDAVHAEYCVTVAQSHETLKR